MSNISLPLTSSRPSRGPRQLSAVAGLRPRAVASLDSAEIILVMIAASVPSSNDFLGRWT